MYGCKSTITFFFSVKGQNQPRLLDFMTPDGKIRSIPKKKKKRLLIRPAEVVDIMDGDSDNEGTTSKPKKKPRLSDDQFMAWVRNNKLAGFLHDNFKRHCTVQTSDRINKYVTRCRLLSV